MRNYLFTSAILSAVLCQGILTESSQAQAPTPRRAESGVRVIDVTAIFKKYSVFQAEVQVKKLAEGLKGLNRGTPEYQRLEAQVAQKRADFTVQAQLQKKQFLEKESEIYYKTYQEIKSLVRLYCQNNGISLVLRFNAEQTDNKRSRPERLRAMNRPVVYEQGIDITLVILDELERRAKNPGTPIGGLPPARPTR